MGDRVDLGQAGRALGDLQPCRDDLGARRVAALGGAERGEVELREVGELPAARLRAGERQLLGRVDRLRPPLDEPRGLRSPRAQPSGRSR